MTAYEQWVQFEHYRLDLALSVRDFDVDGDITIAMKSRLAETIKESQLLYKAAKPPYRRKGRVSKKWNRF